MKKLTPACLLAVLAPLLVLATLALQPDTGAAQAPDPPPVQLGADTNTSGNSATSLGTVDGCVSVNVGDTFDFDIYVSDVVGLVHWELYLSFDPSIVELVDDNDGDTLIDEDPVDGIDNDGDTLVDEDPVDTDMNMFLDINSPGDLKDQWVPYSNGRHFLGAADLGGAPESGSGVLVRLATLHAKAPGLSYAKFLYDDVDDDGVMDIGPRLTGEGGIAIGDVTGDGVFDGPTYDALIAVDEDCPTEAPPPTLPPSPPPPSGDAPPSDTSPPSDDGGGSLDAEPPPAGEGISDSEFANELARVFGVGLDDQDGQNGEAGDANEPDDSEDAPAPVVLRSDATPEASDDSSNLQLGGRIPSSSSGGGFPLWAIGFIAAGILVVGASASLYLAKRSGGDYLR